MIRRTIEQLGRIHANIKQIEHIYMVLISVVVGLLGGLCAVGFRKFIHLGQMVAWQSPEFTMDYVRGLPVWWKILAPAAGGLVTGLIIYWFAREAKGHGVPEVMEAVALRGGRICDIRKPASSQLSPWSQESGTGRFFRKTTMQPALCTST